MHRRTLSDGSAETFEPGAKVWIVRWVGPGELDLEPALVDVETTDPSEVLATSRRDALYEIDHYRREFDPANWSHAVDCSPHPDAY